MTAPYHRMLFAVAMALLLSAAGNSRATVLATSDWSFFPPFDATHYNGAGAPGLGNGEFGPGGAFPGGVYIYPFSDPGGTEDTPLLASLVDLDPVDQFATSAMARSEMYVFPTEVDKQARLALKVDGVWYVHNDLPLGQGGPTPPPVTSGTPIVQPLGPADLAAANWSVLAVSGDPTANTDTLALTGPAGADISGTVEGYGVFRDIADGVPGLDLIGMAIIGIPEPSSVLLLSVAAACMTSARSRR